MDSFDVDPAHDRRRARHALTAVIAFAAAAAGCGEVATHSGDAQPPADAPDRDAPSPLPSLTLAGAGCEITDGDRPPSTGSADSPRVAKLAIGTATASQPLSGGLDVADAQSDAAALVIQVLGATTHLSCPLTAAEIAANHVDLARLTVTAGSGPGSFAVYFGISDAQGNVSGYALGSVALGAASPLAICRRGPVQIIGKAASEPTTAYASMNGTTPDYRVASAPTTDVAFIDRVRLWLDIGDCTHLALGSEPTGTAAVGWDNFLLVEYRTAPGQPASKVWYYALAPTTLVRADSTQPALAVDPVMPTVVGNTLDPPVPSAGLFGYQARAIDFMTEIPAGRPRFELTVDLLDFGGSGSTTEIWLFADE